MRPGQGWRASAVPRVAEAVGGERLAEPLQRLHDMGVMAGDGRPPRRSACAPSPAFRGAGNGGTPSPDARRAE